MAGTAVTGLEDRGFRPEPGMRGSVSRFVARELDHRHRLVRPCIDHELLWGVPCGPTLTMVYPPRLRGLLEVIGDG
jgi:hypothetical protein